jgi:hypothetical protein
MRVSPQPGGEGSRSIYIPDADTVKAFLVAGLMAGRVAMLMVTPGGGVACSQEVPGAAPITAAKSDIFSGNVVELGTNSVTVTRLVPGKEAVTRTFTLDTRTRVEGKLHVKARVTVRFEREAEEPVHALHIIVR